MVVYVCVYMCKGRSAACPLCSGIVYSGGGSGLAAAGLEYPPFPEPRLGGCGEAEKMQKQLPTKQATQMNFACGIPHRCGWRGVGRGRERLPPSVTGSVCARRVWHIPEQTGWSFCGWTSWRRFQPTENSRKVHSEGGRGRGMRLLWYSASKLCMTH